MIYACGKCIDENKLTTHISSCIGVCEICLAKNEKEITQRFVVLVKGIDRFGDILKQINAR